MFIHDRYDILPQGKSSLHSHAIGLLLRPLFVFRFRSYKLAKGCENTVDCYHNPGMPETDAAIHITDIFCDGLCKKREVPICKKEVDEKGRRNRIQVGRNMGDDGYLLNRRTFQMIKHKMGVAKDKRGGTFFFGPWLVMVYHAGEETIPYVQGQLSGFRGKNAPVRDK